MTKLLAKLQTLQKTHRERRLRCLGYQPGAMSDRFRLWWNDDDECVVEERSRDDEAGSYD